MNLNSKRLTTMLVAGVAIASIAGGAVSLAVFTDTETVDATFTSGTIILDPTKIDALNLTSANMVPGDSITGSVDVENDGTNQLRYSLNTTTSSVAGPSGGVLNTALTVEVRTVDVDLVTCGSFDGTVIKASGVLGASTIMFGNPSPTVGTGDRIVAPAATDVLCIKVALPIATGDTFQGATATTTFTFNAEQTANN